MTTEVANANDFYALSPELRRPARTIKTYILLGWIAETIDRDFQSTRSCSSSGC